MTNQAKPLNLPERNPLTHARHRKEVFWQITFPLILCSLLLVAAVVALVLMTVNEARLETALGAGWFETARVGEFSPDQKAMTLYMSGMTNRLSNVSQMWLLMPVLFVVLLTLGILISLVILVTRLLGLVPGWMYRAQDFVARLELRLRAGTEAITAPLIKGKSLAAAVRQARQSCRQQIGELLGKVIEE